MLSYKKIINNLIIKNISVSVAESCTGGQLSKLITDHPGVSKIFNLGLITYSNNAKNMLLNISPKIINKYGAVSEKVAYLMARNLSKYSKSKLCISTTGIAGPDGGSKLKPIGLVYIGITFNKKTFVFKKNLQVIEKKFKRILFYFA